MQQTLSKERHISREMDENRDRDEGRACEHKMFECPVDASVCELQPHSSHYAHHHSRILSLTKLTTHFEMLLN